MQKNGINKLLDMLEFIAPFLVCFCVIVLNYNGKAIGREYLQNAQEALFLEEGVGRYNDRALEDVLVENVHTSTKRIEMYDEQLEPMFQITFNAEPSGPSVYEYSRLREIVEREQHHRDYGQATITIDGTIQAAYYKWLRNSENEQRLVIIYSSLGRFYDYRYMDFVAWGAIILLCYMKFKSIVDHRKAAFEKSRALDRAIDRIQTL